MNWNSRVWSGFTGLRDRLPQAILLYGPPATGKSTLARAFANALLCEKPLPDGRACGVCAACGWVAHGAHPDFHVVEPEARMPSPEGQPDVDAGEAAADVSKKERKSEQISVAQIRATQDRIQVGTYQGATRVVVIDPADTMDAAPSNALLKTLEDTPPNTLFILVTSYPARLLPTLLSRTFRLPVMRPDAVAAANWLAASQCPDPERMLAHSGGLPFMALRMGEQGAQWLQEFEREMTAGASASALDLAETWDRRLAARKKADRQPERPWYDMEVLVSWMQKWVHDLMTVKLGHTPRYHPLAADALRSSAALAHWIGLMGFERALREFRLRARHPLNQRLFLEELFLRYRAIYDSHEG